MLVQIFCPLTFCFLPSSLRFFKIQILHDFCQECLTNPGKRVSKLSPKWITFRCCRGSPQSAKCFWAWSFCLWMSSVYPIFGWQFWKIKRWKIERPPAHLLVALQHLSSSALGPTWRSMVMNIKTISICNAQGLDSMKACWIICSYYIHDSFTLCLLLRYSPSPCKILSLFSKFLFSYFGVGNDPLFLGNIISRSLASTKALNLIAWWLPWWFFW